MSSPQSVRQPLPTRGTRSANPSLLPDDMIAAEPGEGVSRRRMLQAAAALLASGPFAAFAQQRVPIADMHSHYGMFSRRGTDSGLAQDMRDQGVALVAWKLVADSRWIRSTNFGIEQFREPYMPRAISR